MDGKRVSTSGGCHAVAQVQIDFESNTRSKAVTMLQAALEDEEVEIIELTHAEPELQVPTGEFTQTEPERVGHRYITTLQRKGESKLGS